MSPESGPAGTVSPGEVGVLETESVSLSYGHVLALDDVSVSIPAAAVTCLLGDNGAGKSSLIKILSGVVQPSKGTVRLDGREVRFRSPREARRNGIATLFQDLALAPLMSVWRNFVLGAEPVRGRWPLSRIAVGEARRASAEALSSMGIRIPDMDARVGSLSGGQKQAVAIARAVHHGARVLILDEPTAALGVSQAEKVLESVRRVRNRGMAVILVTHNPLHAWPVGDRFVVLRQGRVAGVWDRQDISVDRLARLMAGSQP